jgi:hypothetical protein
MDRWSTEQLTRMEKGGNGKAREFFESKFGAASYKAMTIPERVPPQNHPVLRVVAYSGSTTRTSRWITRTS